MFENNKKVKRMESRADEEIRNGNYHRYYTNFRKEDSRPEYLRKYLPECFEILTDKKASSTIHILDIGCNNGTLTNLIREEMLKIAPANIEIFVLGVDIDSELINEASAAYKSDRVKFIHADISSIVLNERDDLIQSYMASNGIELFDFVSCFSILMYIHLNRGDDGLRKVLDYVCSHARVLILELQSWKKYRDQVHRIRRAGGEYNLYSSLEWRGSNGVLEQRIEDYVTSKGFNLVSAVGEKNEFNRDVIIYAKNII